MFEMDSTAVLLWGLLFGSIGFGFFLYGKKQKKVVPLITGIALCVVPYFIANRLCACHSRSDLNGHPVFCTNMRRKEGAPAKKRRRTGQGADSDHLSFCVVGTGASGPDSTWVKPRARPLTPKLANEKTSDICRRNHRLRRAMKQDSVISSDYTPFLGEAR
jgi:hypothetical protein